MQVHELLKLYSNIDVPPERLLFKIPSTWQVSISSMKCVYTFLKLLVLTVLKHKSLNDSWYVIQGIEASRLLESEGIQTHLTFVYRYVIM